MFSNIFDMPESVLYIFISDIALVNCEFKNRHRHPVGGYVMMKAKTGVVDLYPRNANDCQ